MDQRTGCLICGKDLVYLAGVESLNCVYCGKLFETNARCLDGHYVCDACHSLPALDLIEQYANYSQEVDPLVMAVELMHNPSIKMHGPEHHFLVPAVLLAAVANQRGQSDKAALLAQARRRAENVKGGFCGFYGACGAAIGTGIFVSVLTEATPLSTREWSLANRVTSESLCVIADHGGPRCCKRNTYLALQSAGEFLRERLQIDLPMRQPVICTFTPMNKECLGQQCPFHSASAGQ